MAGRALDLVRALGQEPVDGGADVAVAEQRDGDVDGGHRLTLVRLPERLLRCGVRGSLAPCDSSIACSDAVARAVLDEPGDALPTGTPFNEDAADKDAAKEDAELELEEGALDPDELEADPFEWDEGADDERG